MIDHKPTTNIGLDQRIDYFNFENYSYSLTHTLFIYGTISPINTSK